MNYEEKYVVTGAANFERGIEGTEDKAAVPKVKLPSGYVLPMMVDGDGLLGYQKDRVVAQFSFLPPLSLPLFGGDIVEFESFMQLFDSTIDRNCALPNVLRLYYLRECMRGEPLRMLRNLPLLDVAYEAARDLLQKAYGDESALKAELMKRLQQLPPADDDNDPNDSNNSRVSLQNTFLSVESIVMRIERLDQQFYRGESLRAIVLQKYPSTVLSRLLPSNHCATLSQIRRLMADSFFKWESASAENEPSTVAQVTAVGEAVSEPSAQQSTPRGGNKRLWIESRTDDDEDDEECAGTIVDKGDDDADSSSSAEWRQSSYRNSRPPPWPCTYCHQMHWAGDCDVYPTPAERKLVLDDRNHCHHCLRRVHIGRPCFRARLCTTCGVDFHHRSLCPRNEVRNNNVTKKKTKKLRRERLPTHGTWTDSAQSAVSSAPFTPAPAAAAYSGAASTAGGSRSLAEEEKSNFSRSLLTTVCAYVESARTGLKAKVRLMFTHGDASLLSKSAARRIGLDNFVCSQTKFRCQSSGTALGWVSANSVSILVHRQPPMEPLRFDDVRLVSRIADDAPAGDVDAFRRKHAEYEQLNVADTGSGKPVELLLGSDALHAFTQSCGQKRINVNEEGLYLLNTDFGWLLAGKQEIRYNGPSFDSFSVFVDDDDESQAAAAATNLG